MLTFPRLRSAAFLASLASLCLLHTAHASTDTVQGPGPEELASLGLTAPESVVPMALPVTAAPTPTVGLPREVLEAAGAYRLYMRQAAAVSASFADGPAIAGALELGAAYEPKQMTRGAVAFAAVAALHERRFVEGVRAVGADPARRAALVARLTGAPHSAGELAGADAAAGRAAAALGEEGARVRAAGQRVKQAAYDVQKQAWAKNEVSARVERLALAKSLSAQPLSAPATDLAELQLASLGAGRLSLPEGAPEPSARPVVARGLALAALAVLGEADLAKADRLMEEAGCGSCLRMSKLNLFQCLAVAKPWYEDVFCLGQHVLIDTGDCIQAAAAKQPAPSLPAAVLAAPSRPYKAEPAGALTTVAALH
ncbi:MAG: hypothetical protein KY446_00570 [Proteobacteria bacterium]|nr:hypothetical protein [Pseudomonadota bacterium]